MEKTKYPWESDLIIPPLLNEDSTKDWKELVKERLLKQEGGLKRYRALIVSVVTVVLAITAAAATYMANVDYFQNMKTNGNAVILASHIPHAAFNPEKFQWINGISIEEGAEIKMTQKADLFGNGNEATIALVNLPATPNQAYTGYLGIWDTERKLTQKFEVQGYDILHPVQIKVLDITGDNNPDIILETDAYANGGDGAHVLHIYVQDKGEYIETTLPVRTNTGYMVTLQPANHDFTINSVEDKRKWSVQWSAQMITGQDQLHALDANFLNSSIPVNVDPISSIDLKNNILTTKSLLWFGNLQLNSLAHLATSYHFEAGKWVMQSYSLESIDKMTIVTEQK
jgi:hypothetical protein